MLKGFGVICKWLDLLLKILLCLVTIALVSLTFYGVVMRYIFNSPLTFAYELTLLLFIWLVFTGSSLAFGNNEHVSLDFFEKRLHGKAKTTLYLFINVVIFVFLCIAAKYSFSIVISTWGRTYQTLPTVSTAWFYMGFFFNMAVSAIYAAKHIVTNAYELTSKGGADSI